MKEELRAAEEELAAAEAERDRAARAGAEPARPVRARRRHRRGRRGAAPRRRAGAARGPSTPRSAASRWSARRGSRARASATSSATPRCSRSRSTASRSTAAVAHGHVPMLPPVLVREEAMYGTGFFPTERVEHLRARERRALPDRHLGGRARRLPHGRDPRRAAAPLLGVLDLLPPRGGRRRQGHARHVPRPPVQQGRAVRLLRARALGRGARPAARDRGGDRRGRSASRTASSTSPPATSAPRRRRSTTSRRGSRTSSATARSRRPRTRPTSRRGASASATGPRARRARDRRTR